MSADTIQTPSALGGAAHSQGVPQANSWPRRLFGAIPNLVVFTLLGGVLFLGHHTGWKLPKLSDLRGAAAPSPDDWCTEHLVPESRCVECNKALFPRPKSYGFCRQHGVAECVIDHPELAQVRGEPQLPKYDTVAAIALRKRTENNSRNTLHQHVVQFASAESADKAGIDVDVVQERPMSESLTANGELTFDPTRVAHLSSRTAGTIAAVFKTLGQKVQPGEVLAVVDAAEVGREKSQLLQAIVQLQLRRANDKRLKQAQAAVPGKALLEAETALKEAEIAFLSARQALVNLGFDVPEQLDDLEAREVVGRLEHLGIPAATVAALPVGRKTANLIPLRAPSAGEIVESDVVAGEVVDASKVLFTVADPVSLWLTLNVRQEDGPYVTPGLPVVFHTDDGLQQASGKISWISPAVDERTRTLIARVVIDNVSGKLKDKMFGTGSILLREEPQAITVPRQALQTTSDAQFVFVRDKNFLSDDGPKLFHARQVRAGASDENNVEILAGVLPGEVVATKGSGVLLSQLLRGNLGAGCGCHEH